MQKNVPYQAKLDSLRGIAALSIVFLHFCTYLFPSIGEEIFAVTPVLKRSYLFVDLFFILSGYVLALNYFDTFKHGLNLNLYLNFMIKRFIKLFPLHLFTLGLLVVLYWLIIPSRDPAPSHFQNITNMNTLVLNLGLLHSSGLFDRGCFTCTSWNYPSWSISVEWLVYTITPLAYLLVRRWKKAAILLATLCFFMTYFLVEFKLGQLDYA